MLTKKLEAALNEQVALEAQVSAQYLAMASWCEKHSLKGCAAFFYENAEEERGHMLQIFRYINDMGGHALAPKVDAPLTKFANIIEVVELSLKGEQKVTQAIHHLTELASKEKDYGTYNFLQFFVDEQRDGEVQFQELLDRVRLIGMDGLGLYYIDKEMEAISSKKASAENKG